MSQIHYNTNGRKREHLNYEERKIIERMLGEGSNKTEIARVLYRDKSTIKREIKRGSVVQRKKNNYLSRNPSVPEYFEKMVYFADAGQRVYAKNRERCGAKNKIIECSELVGFIEESILGEKHWSPDTAIGHAKEQKLFPGQSICTKTFYNWIDDGLVKVKNIDLLLKVKRKAKSPRRERKKRLGRSIEERPAAVESRAEFGHWEGDGIVGKGGKGMLITLVERKLGIGFIFNAKTKESKNIAEIIDGLEKRYGEHFKNIFKTVTFDNGTEFSDSAGIEKGGRIQVYYAHPYSSFERGTNENWNGIVRRYIPKGKSFDYLTDEHLARIMHYINTMPRKRFGYKSPMDLWQEEISAIMTA